MALGEDQMVVPRVIWVVEVVVEVLGEEHGRQIGCGHGGRRMTRLGHRCRADGVDPELLAQLTPQVVPLHACNVTSRCGSRSGSTIVASSSVSAFSRRSSAPATSRSTSGPTP